MGFRFSRRIKIAPGVRLNLGLRGVSVSAGVRGANVTLGRHGLFGNVGAPGTGLSYRTKLAGGRRSSRRAPGPDTVTLRFDGRELMLLDERGRALSPAQAEAARRLHRASIAHALRERADTLNDAARASLEVHRETPRPLRGTPAFTEPKPLAPADGARSGPGWSAYMDALSSWRARRAEHERRRPAADPAEQVDAAVSARLSTLEWPRETAVSFDLADQGRTLRLDVDLPELEDMPEAEVHPDLRALTLGERPLIEAARRRAYVRHVHAVVFRLVGEVFAAAGSVDRVLAAGYTQRVSAATGREIDDYVLDVEVERGPWAAIDFDGLHAVEPEAALAAFPLRRDLTRRNELRSIDPPAWAAP